MTSGFKMVALKSAVMTQEYRRKKKKKSSVEGKAGGSGESRENQN